MPAETNKTSPITLQGVCPSCGKVTTFDLLGVQRWPERVAQKSGLPVEQTMWQCRNCQTTLMQASLEPATKSQAS